mgnify:CR=1 FL=1
MRKKDDIIYWTFGGYLTLLAILAFINSFIHPEIAHPLWFSYITLFLIGIGILRKNSELIAVQLNIIAIPVLFWNIDFFYQLITKNSLWGITDYLFDGGVAGSLGNFISMQHTYIIPVALAFLLFLGIKRRDLWKWSLFEAFFIFVLSLTFTVYERNVNCVFESCIDFISIGSPYYQILWLFSVFLMVLLTNSLLVYLLKKMKKAKKLKE